LGPFWVETYQVKSSQVELARVGLRHQTCDKFFLHLHILTLHLHNRLEKFILSLNQFYITYFTLHPIFTQISFCFTSFTSIVGLKVFFNWAYGGCDPLSAIVLHCCWFVRSATCGKLCAFGRLCVGHEEKRNNKSNWLWISRNWLCVRHEEKRNTLSTSS